MWKEAICFRSCFCKSAFPGTRFQKREKSITTCLFGCLHVDFFILKDQMLQQEARPGHVSFSTYHCIHRKEISVHNSPPMNVPLLFVEMSPAEQASQVGQNMGWMLKRYLIPTIHLIPTIAPVPLGFCPHESHEPKLLSCVVKRGSKRKPGTYKSSHCLSLGRKLRLIFLFLFQCD